MIIFKNISCRQQEKNKSNMRSNHKDPRLSQNYIYIHILVYILTGITWILFKHSVKNRVLNSSLLGSGSLPPQRKVPLGARLAPTCGRPGGSKIRVQHPGCRVVHQDRIGLLAIQGYSELQGHDLFPGNIGKCYVVLS